MKRLPVQFFAALTREAGEIALAGHDVINLGQGNPDLPTPGAIVESLREAVLDPATHRYSSFRGLRELREAICGYYRSEYGVTLDPDREVAVLCGAKAGLVELAQCVLNPGDAALLPDPGYPDYLSGVALAGADKVLLPLLEKNSFLPDFDALSPGVLSKAKLLFLNYPNNPTAAVADPGFFERAAKFARRFGIRVVHDFAYGSISFAGKAPSFLQTPGAKDIGVEFFTLSKTYNMAGWRVGFALGNEEVVGLLNEWQDHHYVSLFPAVQRAAAAALTGPQDSVRERALQYRRRQEAFFGALDRWGMRTLPAPGSFFVWLPVPERWGSEAFARRLLREQHVVVAPGTGFGPGGEGYVRVGLLAPEARMAEAGERIGRFARDARPERDSPPGR